MSDSNNIHFGDGVLDKLKSDINDNAKDLIELTVEVICNYLKEKVMNFPEAIERLRSDLAIKQKIAALWSERLFEEGLVPAGYNGLSDSLLISNFHQDGYINGLYVGYILAMIALADNGASKDLICVVRDHIRHNLVGQYYDDRNEIINKYKEDKYYWIETFKKEKE